MVRRVSFYNQAPAMTPAQQAYRTDPRVAMAQALMAQGGSTAPVQSWGEGAARMLQAGVGGYYANQARQEMQAREAKAAADMKSALAGAQAQPWVNPDTGQVAPNQPATGGMEGMQAALMGANNPDLMPFAQQLQMQMIAREQAQQDQEAQFKRQKDLAAFKATLPASGKTPANIAEWNEFKNMSPADQEQYLIMKRSNPYLNLGDVMVQPSPIEPSAVRGGFNVLPKPEQMPEFKREQARSTAAGRVEGEGAAKAKATLPSTIDSGTQMLGLLDQIATFDESGAVTGTHPGFSGMVGVPSLAGAPSMIPLVGAPARGTPEADFQVLLDQVKGKQFMQAYQGLKGGGQITEVEGKKATEAIARMNTAQSEESFLKGMKDFRDVIKLGIQRAREQAGQVAPSEIYAGTGRDSAVDRIGSDAEYEALPPGATFIGPDGVTRRKP